MTNESPVLLRGMWWEKGNFWGGSVWKPLRAGQSDASQVLRIERVVDVSCSRQLMPRWLVSDGGGWPFVGGVRIGIYSSEVDASTILEVTVHTDT